MTFTDIPDGTTNWGFVLNGALNDIQGQITSNDLTVNTSTWRPEDQNIAAWSIDPGVVFGSTALSANTLHMVSVLLRHDATVSNIIIDIDATPGVTITESFAGIYSNAGNLLAQTGSQNSVWTSNGTKVMPLTVATPLSAGKYHAAFFCNAATRPNFARGTAIASGNELINAGLSTAEARTANVSGALTVLPSTVTMSARTKSTPSWWVAFS